MNAHGDRWWQPAAWTALALRHKGWTVGLLALPTLLAVAGAARLRTEVGYRAFLGADHPVVREFDAFVERFGGGLPLVAVWSCRESRACDIALDRFSLSMAYDVATRMAARPSVRSVDSPATSGLLVRQWIGFPKMRHLVEGGKVVADVESLREQALNDPVWKRRLVSEDGVTGALVVHLRDSSSRAATDAYGALRDAVRPYEKAGFEFNFVGGPVEFVVAGADLQRSTRRIIPLMVGVIGVALVLLFGAPMAALSAMLCVGLAVLWTVGTMGWVGWPQNSLTQILPPLVLVVGVCDAIHLLGRYAALPADWQAEPAMLAAAAEIGSPCVLTTLTTLVGFGSLGVSGLESISRFGVLAAVGVAVALLLTFTALPVLVCAAPRAWFVLGGTSRRWSGALDAVGRAVTGSGRMPIIAVAVVAAVAGVWGARGLRVEVAFEDLYGADSDVVRWAHATSELLRAPDTLELAIEPPAGAGLPPRAFAIVDRVQRELAGVHGLGQSLSIVDVLRRLNGWLHRDELPLGDTDDDKGRPSSVYRLLRNRDPSVTDDLVDSDTPALRISVESEKLPQAKLRALLDEVAAVVERVVPPGWSASVTGPLAVVGRMIDAIRQTQLRSFGLAAVAIFVLVVGFFRSLRLGLLAMVPTVLPVVVTVGAMGWLGIPLDVGSGMVASVVLGLAVDDAIHWLAQYVRERGAGASAADASRRAVLRTGRAMVTTSVALAVGFCTLSFSAWHSIASFGIIAAVAILTALLAALFLLPAIASR